jgi:dUTP pyrophosphatase
VNVNIITINGATVPQYQTDGAVGFDIASSNDIEIAPKEFALIPTGLIIKVPEGYMLGIVPRSSTPRRTGLIIPHGIGIIDNDYHGPKDEIMVQLYNVSGKSVMLKKGDRIAQGLFFKVAKVKFIIQEKQIKKSSRGGFGSTT